MENVLEISNDLKQLKKVSVNSSDLPDKLRLTIATLISLQKNIHDGKIPESADRYNKRYVAVREQLQRQENERAESEVRESIKSSEAGIKIFEEDAFILRVSTEEVVHDRSEALSIKIGTLSKGLNPKIKILKGFSPKPLKVEGLQARLYGTIGKKVRKDKMSEVQSVEAELLDDTPSWKKLFPDRGNASVTELFVINDSEPNVQKETSPPTLNVEELHYKKMIGKIYDELSSIRKRMKSSTGYESPFEKGLKEREVFLMSMLSDVTGVNFPKAEALSEKEYEQTEIQNIIDDVVGFVEPKTDAERKAIEKDLEDYYSDPNVSEIIDRLRHKDVLFSFNNPDFYDSVSKAEARYNAQTAEKMVEKSLSTTKEKPINPEFLMSDEDVKLGAEEQAKILFVDSQYAEFIKKGADEQAKMLKTLNDYMLESAKADEEMLRKGSESQAQELFDRNNLIYGAEVQARELQAREVTDALKEGAVEEARSILRKQQEIKNKEVEAQRQFEASANDQARELFDRNNLIDGAGVQARELQARGITEALKEGAVEEARSILRKQQESRKKAVEEQQKLEVGANEQAQELFDRNNLIDGAEVQARSLKEKNELIEGAEEQAILLNYSRSLLDSHEQIVRQIVYSSASDDKILNGAEEQAQMLMDNNERIVIEQGAVEEARRLFEMSKRTTLDDKAKVGFQSTELNCSYPLLMGDPRPIKLGGGQFSNFIKRVDTAKPKASKKELLQSMRDQLSSENLDFLRLSEDVGRSARAA